MTTNFSQLCLASCLFALAFHNYFMILTFMLQAWEWRLLDNMGVLNKNDSLKF